MKCFPGRNSTQEVYIALEQYLIYKRYVAGESLSSLAQMLGISQQRISQILKGDVSSYQTSHDDGVVEFFPLIDHAM